MESNNLDEYHITEVPDNCGMRIELVKKLTVAVIGTIEKHD